MMNTKKTFGVPRRIFFTLAALMESSPLFTQGSFLTGIDGDNVQLNLQGSEALILLDNARKRLIN